MKKNTPSPERNDLLASSLALAARVRSYRESDFAKLQELFHKNYPELVTPEFTNQDQLSLPAVKPPSTGFSPTKATGALTATHCCRFTGWERAGPFSTTLSTGC